MKRIILVLALCACPPQPQPAPHDADAAQFPSPTNACATMASLGCIEGADVHCVDVIAHVVDAGLEPLDLACIVGATSKDAARACKGGPRCE